MESGKLTITLHSGRGLRDVKHFGTMNPYAKIWIKGDTTQSKHKTNTAEKAASDPEWEFSTIFNNISINKDCILVIQIKHGGKLTRRHIGEVQVRFADLLAGGASGDRVRYKVTIPSGERMGEIIVSHKFSDVSVRSCDEDGTDTGSSDGDSSTGEKKNGPAKEIKRVLTRMATSIAATIAAELAVEGIMD